ncbi:VanZ family protein [Microbacterium timonense]|uniref:VanZ family protein n=1 Tax=Microbacterium timonense TaxID=2086576 RepID=UPI000D0F57CF|nr:VanZ family protein [Microbacterium timonense]
MLEGASSRRRWVIAGLVAYGVAVGLVLLLPISYSGIVNRIGDALRDGLGIDWFGSGWIEFGANILMFVPLGFLLTLMFRHPWYGVALAIALSAAAELAQIVIPSRQPTLRDILANTLGAAVGGGVAWLIVLRTERRAARRATASGGPPTGTTRAR